MKAHNVIILTAGRVAELSQGRIDQLITFVTSLKKNPIVILGPDGDDLLRNCRLLDSCDVVFDPNFEGEEFSSVKAGLQAVHGASFVLRAAAPIPERSVWVRLEQELLNSQYAGADVFGSTHFQDKNALLLLTQRGVNSLRNQPAVTNWLKSDDIVFSVVDLAAQPSRVA